MDPDGGALHLEGGGGGPGHPGGDLQPLHHQQQRQVHSRPTEIPPSRLLLPHPSQQQYRDALLKQPSIFSTFSSICLFN
jgi:hypothetical protein